MNPLNLRAFALFFFVFAALIFSASTFAALSMAPTVDGYSGGRGLYRSSAGSFSYPSASNASSYGATGIVNVGGKAATVPANLRIAANAGNYVKNALRLNPYLLAGTLALPYLLDFGLEYIEGQGWVFPAGSPYPGYAGAGYPNCDNGFVKGNEDVVRDYAVNRYSPTGAYCANNGGCSFHAFAPNSADVGWGLPDNWNAIRYWCSGTPNPARRQATEDDWNNLPDPLPALAPELPYAPYLPEGVPVSPPNYDFPPFSVPIGEPYSRPDGSTVQPSARISPNGDTVTVDTYDQPLTDPAGQPVQNPQPQDTPEPQPESKTDCDKFPDSVGCLAMGTVDDSTLQTEQKTIASISPVSVGGVGSCPAPLTTLFMGHPITMTYDLPCQAAGMLKPLILALSWLSAGVIFIGGVRQ